MQERFGDVLIPAETVVEMKKGKEKTGTRSFFPGYLLVNMELDESTWHLVRHTPKVTGFVGGQQGQLDERRAEQGSGDQRTPQFGEHRGGVGQLAARTAELLRDYQGGDADLFTQHLPELGVVAELRVHRRSNLFGSSVFGDEVADRLGEQVSFVRHLQCLQQPSTVCGRGAPG